jgi:hypothetical protein
MFVTGQQLLLVQLIIAIITVQHPMAIVEATMVHHLMELATTIMEVHHLIHTDERNVQQLNARSVVEIITMEIITAENMEEVMAIKEVMVIKAVMEEVMEIKEVMEEVMEIKEVMEEVMVIREVIQNKNMVVVVFQASLEGLFHFHLFHLVSDLIFSQLSKTFDYFYFRFAFGSFCFTRSSWFSRSRRITRSSTSNWNSTTNVSYIDMISFKIKYLPIF